MKVKVSKVNARVAPKCKCEEHFLELCTGFDGEIFSFERYCYVCGKSWVHKEGICGKKGPRTGDIMVEYADGSVKYFRVGQRQEGHADICPRVGDLVFLDRNGCLTLKQDVREVPLKGTLDRHFIEKWNGMEYVRIFTKHVIFTGNNGFSCVLEFIDGLSGGHCVFVVKKVLKKG